MIRRFFPVLLLVAAPLAAQRPDALPLPENLVADGLPPIPAGLREEVRRYTEFRTAGFVAWNPLKREMLISTRFANTAQLHRVRAPGADRTQLTFFDEPVGEASWSRDGGSLVFSRDAGGNEFGQLYRLDLADGRVTLLSDGGRSQNGGVRWSTRGDRIAYGSTRRNGADRDIYVADPRDPGRTRRIAELSGGGWSVADWSLDDKELVLQEYLSVNQSRLWRVSLVSGMRDLLYPVSADDTVAVRNARYSRDGQGLYFIGDAGSEFARLTYLSFSSGRTTVLTPGLNWDVTEFELSPDGKRIAFVTNEAGTSRVHILDLATRRGRPLYQVPTGIVSNVTWRPQGDELGFTLSSARVAADAYSMNFTTGSLIRWTESETGGLDTSTLPEPELVKWTSFDGREITGFLYRPLPKFTGPRPVLINIHGGPESQSRPGFQGRNNYFLMELGVAIIYPNVRGSTGYGKSFVKLDNGMKREDSVRDIGALLDWIDGQVTLDASKIMVTGGSYGGFMTLAVATTYNDRICCSLDVVGISHFTTFLERTEAYRRDLRRAEYGDEREPAMRAFFDSIAPLHRADRISRPLFVVQGANDPRVPQAEAEQMVAAVKKNKGPVWYLLARDEGHGFRKKANQDYQFLATIAFMRQHLLGAATP